MKLSIIVPTYNRSTYLDACLSSFFAQKISPDQFEVIVVDNGPSTDNTPEIVAAYQAKYPNIIYEKTTETGCIFSRNFGFARARGSILLTTDDDIELLHEDIFSRLIADFEDPEIAMVGSVELRGTQIPARIAPKEYIHPKNPIGVITKWGNFYGGYEQLDGAQNMVDVDHFRSCFMAVRADVFKKVGGFRPYYHADGMGFRYESDLCLRVHRLKKRVVVDPDIRVWHKAAPRKRGFKRAADLRNLLLTSRNHMFFMIQFFWSQYPYFWFMYDTLIGSRAVPGIAYLIRNKHCSIATVKNLLQGKIAGWRMYQLHKND